MAMNQHENDNLVIILKRPAELKAAAYPLIPLVYKRYVKGHRRLWLLSRDLAAPRVGFKR